MMLVCSLCAERGPSGLIGRNVPLSLFMLGAGERLGSRAEADACKRHVALTTHVRPCSVSVPKEKCGHCAGRDSRGGWGMLQLKPGPSDVV